MTAPASCPCDSNDPYSDCCGRWHAAPGTAPDAATLMRSRYTAFVLDRIDYLRATWAPEHCPDDLTPNPVGLKWLGLEVRAQHTSDAEHATVEFVARSKQGGRAHRLHERSRFERREGRWLYVDGDLLG